MPKTYKFFLFILFFSFVSAFSYSASSSPLLTKKQRFSVDNFQTTSGKIIPRVDIGWESYGELSANKDNVILIAHYYSGTSHAAGKYNATDTSNGYWDSIIGPGKAIDTNKYFVLSSDTLVNVNFKDPNVITTGPASINPLTRKPYGISFPLVNVRDFVNVQHALLESLDIKTLHAVAGPSMGAVQALEWASAYPSMVERVIAVVGYGELGMFQKAAFSNWAASIKLDPNWNDGDYYGKAEPINGMISSLRQTILAAYYNDFLQERFEDDANTNTSPKNSILADYTIDHWMQDAASARAKISDANHILYLSRAAETFRIGHGNSMREGIAPIQAKTLLIPATNDQLLPLTLSKNLYKEMKAQGKRVAYEEIEGPFGHLDGIVSIAQKSDVIKDFIETN